MSSCVLPVFQKLHKRRTKNEIKLGESDLLPRTLKTNHDVIRPPSNGGPEQGTEEPLIKPKRDSHGFTIDQKVGTFPNEVSLSIRHNHPTLGLSDAAYQRAHQSHHMNPDQYQRLQVQLQPPRPQSRGVLSLGLPSHLKSGTLFKRTSTPRITDQDQEPRELDHDQAWHSTTERRRSLPRNLQHGMHAQGHVRRRPLSAHGDLIKKKNHRSTKAFKPEPDAVSSSSGHYSTERSPLTSPVLPPRMGRMTLPNQGPPPRHLLPTSLSPCPMTKMHPIIPGLILQQQHFQHHSKSGMKIHFKGSKALVMVKQVDSLECYSFEIRATRVCSFLFIFHSEMIRHALSKPD